MVVFFFTVFFGRGCLVDVDILNFLFVEFWDNKFFVFWLFGFFYFIILVLGRRFVRVIKWLVKIWKVVLLLNFELKRNILFLVIRDF